MRREETGAGGAADITRGCVDPAVNLRGSLGEVGTLLSV